jgi:hypothetical protein
LLTSPADRLTELRNGLLRLHKTLLDSERRVYERDMRRIGSSQEFLSLVMNDPWFAWLRELSRLIVLIDETLAQREEPEDILARADRLIGQARSLVAPAELGAGFQKQYYESMQRDPEVVLAHSSIRKVFEALRPAGGPSHSS